MNRARVIAGIAVEKGSGNVYADLGYPDSAAMALKAELAAQIAGLIRKQGLTQVQAAAKLGLTQPKISALLKGQFRGISERRLLDCLTHLGRDVQIVVKPSRSTGEGRLTVRIA